MRILIPLIALGAAAFAQPSPLPTQPSTAPANEPCVISGSVVNALTGEPLSKARLALNPTRHGSPFAAQTGASGHFTIDQIPPGEYSLTISRNGFVNQVYSPDGKRLSSPLTLKPGEKLHDIVVRLNPQGVITGRVTDQDGDPVPHVEVDCLKANYRTGQPSLVPIATAHTNDLGEYRLFGLRPGRFVVVATDTPRVASGSVHVPTYYPNSRTANGASRVNVTPGAVVPEIDLRLLAAHTHSVRGCVLPESSEPGIAEADQFVVTVRSGSDSTSMVLPMRFAIQIAARGPDSDDPIGRRGARADFHNCFQIDGVPAGSYTLTASSIDSGVPHTGRLEIEVADSNLDDVRLIVRPFAQLIGRIQVEGDGDLRGAYPAVYLQPKASAPGFSSGGAAPVDRTGAFMLSNVLQDHYSLFVSGLPEGFYISRVQLGDRDVTSGLDFRQTLPSGDVTVFLNPNGGAIEGTVQNSKGEAAVNAIVTLIPPVAQRNVPAAYRTAETDTKGHFTISSLRPGDYRIYAWDDIEPDACQDPDFMKPHEPDGQAVTINDGGRETVRLLIIPADTSR